RRSSDLRAARISAASTRRLLPCPAARSARLPRPAFGRNPVSCGGLSLCRHRAKAVRPCVPLFPSVDACGLIKLSFADEGQSPLPFSPLGERPRPRLPATDGVLRTVVLAV